MSDHIIRYNGDQNYCSRCRCSWDRNEDAPPDCNLYIEPQQRAAGSFMARAQKKLEMSEKFKELRKAMDTGDFSKLL